MGNKLLQEARRFVNVAKATNSVNQGEALRTAKNALNSAYANSTSAEQHQLQQMQNELEQMDTMK